MIFYQTVTTLIANLAGTSEFDGIWHELCRAGSKFGLPHLIVVDFKANNAGVLFSTLHETLHDKMRGMPKVTLNPLLERARTSEEPFLKSELPEGVRDGDHYCKVGLPDRFEPMEAVVVPIYEETAISGCICFAGDHDNVDRRTVHTLAAAAYATWMHANTVRRRNLDRQELSSREMECLRLVAAGRTDEEIGRALGISRRTVRFHVGNAKLKLGVRSRIQAITAQFMPPDAQQIDPDRNAERRRR